MQNQALKLGYSSVVKLDWSELFSLPCFREHSYMHTWREPVSQGAMEAESSEVIVFFKLHSMLKCHMHGSTSFWHYMLACVAGPT